MLLICGLGNPDTTLDKYQETRHNAGFLFIDHLLKKLYLDKNKLKSKFQSLYTLARILDHDVILMKPQSFMNNSGKAVYELCHFYKIKAKNTFIIHDELDLKFTEIRNKFAGGHAGHNGLKDIDRSMTNKYHRIRIGIGHPKNSNNPFLSPADYVLSKFSIAEKNQLTEIFERSYNNLLDIIKTI
jgi:PTH1 family peptidyl-tRNA hydrolase